MVELKEQGMCWVCICQVVSLKLCTDRKWPASACNINLVDTLPLSDPSSNTHLCVQEFPLSGSWPERGSEWPGSGLCHRHSGRCRRKRHSAAAKAICGHDPHPDFCWGLGSVRAHCRPHPVHKIIIHNISTARSMLCCCWRKVFKRGKICLKSSATQESEKKNELKWHHNYGLISKCTVVSVW